MSINLDAKANITYKKSYVVFLDVLGFKNLVFSDKPEDKNKLNIYFGVVNSVLEYLKSISSKEEIKSIVISDSVILSLEHGSNEKDNIDKLRNLCIAVGLIQYVLALKGIWIRGAISSGDTYFDEQKNQIIGKAYINAYLLEENVAKFPRVIFDSKIIKEMNFSNAQDFIDELNMKINGGLSYDNWSTNIVFDWKNKWENHNEFIEKDIPLFIDYLSPLSKNDGVFLFDIINHIEKNIYTNTQLYEKFKWVTDYLRTILDKNDNQADNIIRAYEKLDTF